MLPRAVWALCLALLPCALAGRVVMEQDAVFRERTSQWQRLDHASPSARLTVYFMLKHSPETLRSLEQRLFAVSDPRSPTYGRHLTQDEIASAFPVVPNAVSTVTQFLAGHAAMDVSPAGDIIAATLTVATAETLFGTRIHSFQHLQRTGVTVLRAVQPYSLPQEVAAVVSVVGDLIALPSVRGPISSPRSSQPPVESWPNACTTLSGCADLITPAVLREAYNVPAPGQGTAGNSMSVAEFQGQYYLPADLKKFSTGCKVNVTVDTVIGGDEPIAGIESELDIEYIKGLSSEVPLTVVYSSDYSLLDWLLKILKLASPPLVHSVSYGNDEAQQTSVAYMESVNAQFQKAGIRGLTILFASGDQGVCGREGCQTRFNPDFPGASPYVTAVGGTNFAKKSVIGTETTWSGSGGGFSDTFAIPSYQTTAVAAYKSNPDAKLPAQKWWNNTGRGYPDIAALGGLVNSYCVVYNEQATGVAGTSAASPVAAAIFAKLNALRLAAGKSALGFLNPFIYQNGGAFNDVTTGVNSGDDFSTLGFHAVTGWDPATGWGSPNYQKLSAVVASLP